MHVLSSSAKDLFAAEGGAADLLARCTDSAAAAAVADSDEEQRSHWLLSFTKALWAIDSIKSSAHVGLIVAWLLSVQKHGKLHNLTANFFQWSLWRLTLHNRCCDERLERAHVENDAAAAGERGRLGRGGRAGGGRSGGAF